MIKRLALLFLALLLPVVAAFAVAHVALRGVLPIAPKNTTPITPPAATADKVPNTLEEAKSMTAERLAHLQKLSQAEWDAERIAILRKSPPATIEAAIARAQKRLDDLGVMKPEEWPAEQKRLQDRVAQTQ